MLKKIFAVMKKVVFSGFLLYGYNLLASPLNIIIPINFINIGVVSFLGIPALFSLILIHILMF